MARTITSANAVFTLSIPDIFPVPITLQGFATDDAFDNENVELAEAKMGVDGRMSAGYTPNPTKMTLHFQADSDSIDIIEQWGGAMKAAQEVFFAQASIVMQSVGRSYTFTQGALTGFKNLPDAKKLLEPVTYTITWESVNPANL